MTEEATQTKPRRGRKPRPAVIDTNSPEFKAALATATSEAVSSALAQLQGSLTAQTADTGSMSLINGLAAAIAEIGSQGTGRRVIPPHVIKEQQEARDRMVDLILKARKEKLRATYQLRNKVVLAERIIEPFWIASDHTSRPTEIDWLGVPNEAMVPVNETAKAIFEEFKASIGTYDKPVRDERLGVTPGGLVVRNAAVTDTMQKRTPGEAPHVGSGSNDDEGLTVHHEAQPGRYKAVNVLGTIQPPAQQTI